MNFFKTRTFILDRSSQRKINFKHRRKHEFTYQVKVKWNSHSKRCDVVSAWCEGLPEEAAAACLALSLGEGNVSPYHLLPDSHLLLPYLWRSGEHLALFGRHQFREKLEQEQVSEILTEGSKRKLSIKNITWNQTFSSFYILAISKCWTHNSASHLVVCEFWAP